MLKPLVVSFVALASLASSAQAQLSIDWWTIDGGGGTSTGGSLSLSGTIGQPDAGLMTGGAFTLVGGFWGGFVTEPCPADLDDGSFTGTPDGGVTVDDLLYFLDRFEAGDAAVDLDDGSFTGTPDGGVTVDDLIYFLDRFQGGC